MGQWVRGYDHEKLKKNNFFIYLFNNLCVYIQYNFCLNNEKHHLCRTLKH